QADRDDQAPAPHARHGEAPRDCLRHPALPGRAGVLRLRCLGDHRVGVGAVREELRAESRPRLRRPAHGGVARPLSAPASLTDTDGARSHVPFQEGVMAYSTASKSAAVRARLDPPVIDGDGHWLEPVPIFLDYLRDVAGPTVVERFRKMATAHIDRGWDDMTPAERLDRRPPRPTSWGQPPSTLGRATAMIPKLFYERLDDFGIDFAMLYTSLGLFHIANPDEELRRAIARAVNTMNAEMFRPYAHRIAPAAVVPVHTPQEAI